ncbi:MAG: ribosome recycling factor [Bacteroidetes bacterium]|nr:MAG: ribosome recycling factor [Bacteroidota bacterium]
MNEEVELLLDEMKEQMDKAIKHLKDELLKIRAGKASPSLVEDLLVDYYGAPTPLKRVATVAASDAKTLTIQPWEKSMLGKIEKSIFEANLGLTPMNNGEVVIINIPPLTEERRRDYVKRAKALGEEGKVSLRTARHKAMAHAKEMGKEGFPEDEVKRLEAKIDEITKSYTEKINHLVEVKEKEIMTI